MKRRDFLKVSATGAAVTAVASPAAQFVLVAQVDHVGQVPQPAGAQLVLDVEGVLERRALAGAHPVPHPDDQGLPLPGPQLPDHAVQRPRRLHRVPGRAHRQGVPVRSQPRGGGEVQLRPGGVDQVVVAQPLAARPPGPGGWTRCPRRAAHRGYRLPARSPPPGPGGTRCPAAGTPAPAGTSPPPAASARPRPRCSTGSSSSPRSATRPPPRGPCRATAADAGQQCAPKSRPRGSPHAP